MAGFCTMRMAMMFSHAIRPTPMSPSAQARVALWKAPNTTMPMMPRRSSSTVNGRFLLWLT
ncbi:hypothetical protein D3C74_492690 [compost metagenome]